MTSTIWRNWPSGFGPEVPRVVSHAQITARIALTSAAVSAVGVRFGLCSRETLSIGLRGSTSCRTASANDCRSTVLARLADEYELLPSCLSRASQRATPISRRVKPLNAGSTRRLMSRS